MINAKQFMEKTVDYWQEYFEFTADLPDGAWFQSHVDTFESSALDKCCEAMGVEKPDGDGLDLMRAYLALLPRR